MPSARTAILSRIRQALNRQNTPADIDAAFAQLMQPMQHAHSAAQPPLPAATVESFSRAAADNGAEVHHIDTLEDLPRWIAARAAELGLTPGVVVSPQFADAGLQWTSIETLDRVHQASDWGLARGYAGIAETGTIVSVSRDCPSSSLFLVQRLIVVLDRADIVDCQEEVWSRLRQRFNDQIPRTVNLITGPSRTADVEQQIQIGAHGPKWTDYVIVG